MKDFNNEYFLTESYMKDNKGFFMRLKQLSQSTGKSFNQIERELKFPRNALHNYKNNIEPSASRLLILSKYFNVSPEYLMGLPNLQKPTDLEKYFESLSLFQKKELYGLCMQWVNKELLRR